MPVTLSRTPARGGRVPGTGMARKDTSVSHVAQARAPRTGIPVPPPWEPFIKDEAAHRPPAPRGGDNPDRDARRLLGPRAELPASAAAGTSRRHRRGRRARSRACPAPGRPGPGGAAPDRPVCRAAGHRPGGGAARPVATGCSCGAGPRRAGQVSRRPPDEGCLRVPAGPGAHQEDARRHPVAATRGPRARRPRRSSRRRTATPPGPPAPQGAGRHGVRYGSSRARTRF